MVFAKRYSVVLLILGVAVLLAFSAEAQMRQGRRASVNRVLRAEDRPAAVSENPWVAVPPNKTSAAIGEEEALPDALRSTLTGAAVEPVQVKPGVSPVTRPRSHDAFYQGNRHRERKRKQLEAETEAADAAAAAPARPTATPGVAPGTPTTTTQIQGAAGTPAQTTTPSGTVKPPPPAPHYYEGPLTR